MCLVSWKLVHHVVIYRHIESFYQNKSFPLCGYFTLEWAYASVSMDNPEGKAEDRDARFYYSSLQL